MTRPSSDVDPKREDLARKRRRRKHRDKPEPAAELKAKKPELRKRAMKRPQTPAVVFEQDAEGDWQIDSPHSDVDLWELQIADAIGTRSQAVMSAFVWELQKLCGTSWDRHAESWKPNERELSAILAMLADAQPKTIAQACLVAQSIAVHLVTMRLAAQALNSGGMVVAQDAGLLGKLARTYAQQMQTLRAMQGKQRTTRQTFRTKRETHHHQHIHVHRGQAENDGQPHTTDGGFIRATGAGEPAERAALPSPDALGEVVPFPSGEGEAGLPNARRRKSGGAKG